MSAVNGFRGLRSIWIGGALWRMPQRCATWELMSMWYGAGGCSEMMMAWTMMMRTMPNTLVRWWTARHSGLAMLWGCATERYDGA
jgi:hypothetical protein